MCLNFNFVVLVILAKEEMFASLSVPAVGVSFLAFTAFSFRNILFAWLVFNLTHYGSSYISNSRAVVQVSKFLQCVKQINKLASCSFIHLILPFRIRRRFKCGRRKRKQRRRRLRREWWQTEKDAQKSNHIYNVPTSSTGACFWENTISRCVHKRRASLEAGLKRSKSSSKYLAAFKLFIGSSVF